MTLTPELLDAIAKRDSMDARYEDPGPHKHEDSGWRCLVYHGPGQGECYRCSICSRWIAVRVIG